MTTGSRFLPLWLGLVAMTFFVLLTGPTPGSAGTAVRGADDVGKPKPTITSLTLKPTNVTRGASAKLTISVRNRGDVAARNTRVCVKLPDKVRNGIFPKPACKPLGTLRHDVTRSAEIMLLTSLKAVPKIYLTAVVTATDAKTDRKQILLRTKP